MPGLHIAHALEEKGIHEIAFLGAGRPAEDKILGGLNYTRYTLELARVKSQGVKGFIKFLLSFPLSVWRINSVLKDFKPAAVIGMGGYVAALPLMVAKLKGIPTWAHEAERKPGWANYFATFFADQISLAFPDAEMPRWAKTVYTGHPVRSTLKSISELPPSTDQPHKILILGGSQGARALDQGLQAIAPYLSQRSVEVWHQCREENLVSMEEFYKSKGIRAKVQSFISDMDAAYTWADVIIARAGAATVMEVEAINKPAIFVPYPFAQGNHQKFNALTLVDRGKGLLVEEGDGFAERLQAALVELLNKESYSKMQSVNIERRSITAASEIAERVLALIKK